MINVFVGGCFVNFYVIGIEWYLNGGIDVLWFLWALGFLRVVLWFLWFGLLVWIGIYWLLYLYEVCGG